MKKVLIVDDLKENIFILKVIIESFPEQYRILSSENGKDAIDIVEKEPPDVILMDIQMPEIDGFEVCRIIRRNEKLPYIPIIFLTAHALTLADKMKGFSLGADDYMVKPFEKGELYCRINSVLRIKGLQDELLESNQHLDLLVKKRTRELIESEVRYETVVENAKEGVIIIQDNLIKFVNSAFTKITGYVKEEALNRHYLFIIHPEEQNFFLKKLPSLICGRGVGSYYEFSLLGKKNQRILVEGSFSLLSFANRPACMLVFRDMTERKRAEEKEFIQRRQLILADKMKSLGIIVSGVAHEINNPNNFIMLNSQILSDIIDNLIPVMDEHYSDPKDIVFGTLTYGKIRDKLPDLISSITESSVRIQNIVRKLRNYSSHDMAGYCQEVDIIDVIQSAVLIIDSLIKKSTNVFSVIHEKGLPSVRGNRQELEQVIINLITNSCQSLTSAENKIEVRTGCLADNGSIFVKVIDEGIGIEKENLGKIFDPFFTTKRSIGGTGLGLSVSYTIIKNHNGKITFKSASRKGTTVTVELPAY